MFRNLNKKTKNISTEKKAKIISLIAIISLLHFKSLYLEIYIKGFLHILVDLKEEK